MGNVFFYDRGDVAKTMKEKELIMYQKDSKKRPERCWLNAIDNLSEARDADVIVIGVKNYNLEEACKELKNKVGDGPVIVAMQNGVENQHIIPKYFSKVIYCVVGYNAWFSKPGLLGYQKKGPLIFGTLQNELQQEMKQIAAIFAKGVNTVIVDHIQDAVHSKLIINLTNSLTTLIGFGFRKITDMKTFQILLTNLLYEGTMIAKAAGYKECKIGGMPPWFKIKAGATMPRFLTKFMFKNNVKKMVISSMAQDIIQRKQHESEIESINGYFCNLAETNGIPAPFNKTIYELCLREFARPVFNPLDVNYIWLKVCKNKR